MSDGGKSEKPQPKAIERAPSLARKIAEYQGEPVTGRTGAAALHAHKQKYVRGVEYRFSEGEHGEPPLAHLAQERGRPVREYVGREEAGRAMRKATGEANATSIPKGTGASLPGDVRAKMEPRLGADLSAVKVHTGGESVNAAAGFGARAFTVGSDVHFGAGQFAPGTKEGDKLLAHELTHVVQGQKSGVKRKADDGHDESKAEHADTPDVSQPDEPAEKEADDVSEKVAADIHGDADHSKSDKNDGQQAGKKKDGSDGKKGGGTDATNDKKAAASHDKNAGDAETKADGAQKKEGSAEKAPDVKAEPAPVAAKLISAAQPVVRVMRANNGQSGSSGNGGNGAQSSSGANPSGTGAQGGQSGQPGQGTPQQPPAPKIAKTLVSSPATVDKIDGKLYVELAGQTTAITASGTGGTPEAQTNAVISKGGQYNDQTQALTVPSVQPATLKAATNAPGVAQAAVGQTGLNEVKLDSAGSGLKLKGKAASADDVEIAGLFFDDLQSKFPSNKWFSKAEAGALLGLGDADVSKLFELWKQPSPRWGKKLEMSGHAAGTSYTFDLSARDQRNPPKVREYAAKRWDDLVKSPLWIDKVKKWEDGVPDGTAVYLRNFVLTVPNTEAVDFAASQIDKIPPYPVTTEASWPQLFTAQGIRQEVGGITTAFSLHRDFNQKVGDLFVHDVQEYARHIAEAPAEILTKLDGVVYHNNSDVGNIEMPGGDPVDPALKAAVPSGTGETAPIFEFMKQMAKRQPYNGYKYKDYKLAMEKGPNKTYLAGKVRDAYKAESTAEGAGAHEWYPSEMFQHAIEKAAAVIMNGDVATEDVKTLKMGYAWIELQHDMRTETYRIIFNKSIEADEPTGDPMNPSVKKPMLQGHSGAIKGPRNPMEDKDYIPQNSFQNGGNSFHDGLKKAFQNNDDVTKIQDAVEGVVTSWSWSGTGAVHMYCKMATGPNVNNKPTAADATDGRDQCLADIRGAFAKAKAKLQP